MEEQRNGVQTLERVEQSEQSLVIPSFVPNVRELVDEYAAMSARDRQLITAEVLGRWAADLAPGDFTLGDIVRSERKRQQAFETLHEGADLTKSEWTFWRYLQRNEGQVVTYLQIARHLWNSPKRKVTAHALATQNGYAAPMIITIHGLASSVRKKTEIDPARAQHLANIRGVGYVFYWSPPAKHDGVDYAKRALETSVQREQIRRDFGLIEGTFVAVQDKAPNGMGYRTRLSLGPEHPDYEE